MSMISQFEGRLPSNQLDEFGRRVLADIDNPNYHLTCMMYGASIIECG